MLSPFSLESLIAWLKTKPEDEEYQYSDPSHCLNAQYLKAKGFPVCGVGATFWFDKTGGTYPLPAILDQVAIKTPTNANWRRTFGAALAVAEKRLASQAQEETQETQETQKTHQCTG